MSAFRKLHSNFRFLPLFLALFFSVSVFGDDVANGEKIFKQNCTACHMMTDARLVGPGLKGITDKYEKEWLISWIRNSQALIASGDERAIAIFEEYNKSVMTSFDFSDDEFSDLLAYLANPPVKEDVVAAVGGGVSTNNQGMATSTILMIIALVLAILVFLLISVKNSLKTALGQDTETVSETLISKYKFFISNNINVLFLASVFAIVMLKFTYDE